MPPAFRAGTWVIIRGKTMSGKKTSTLAAIILIILTVVSVAKADLTLTVNDLDASERIEVRPDDDIIIAVAGQTDEQKENYLITCEVGGKLTPLPGPNTLSEEQKENKYLFTFEDEELSLAIINLTVVDILNYQLIFFKVPDANTVIFGIDSDSIETPGPEPQLEQEISTLQITSSATGESGIFLAGGAGDCNEVLDPNWYPNLNNDQSVNFEDFAILGTNWQQSGSGLAGDFDDNKIIDFNDMVILAYHWLANACGPSPEEVFELFKSALLADDVNEAVSYFAEVSAENYRTFLEQLRPYFTQMVNDMGELLFIRFDTDMVIYDILREENGQMYGYPVTFVRDEKGQWKIYDF